MRSRTVMLRWSVMMLGLVLVGLMLTSSSGQARVFGSPEGAQRDDAIERDPRSERGVRRGGDRFNALVSRLRAQEGVEDTSPPFIWLASLAVRAVRPAGVLDMRLATFEGRDLSDLARDRDFAEAVRESAGDGWSPLVQVRSRRNGELVNIQARSDRDYVSLMIVTIDRHDAVVIQVAVKPETLAEWIKTPARIQMRARMTE